MSSDEVDDFVEARVLPQFRDIVAMIRQLMRETAPAASEAIRYGIPTWKATRIFAFLSPTKRDITFAFARGVQFEDKYHLLKGAGKVSRHLKLKSLKDVDAEVLRYYVNQALEFDAK